MYMYKMYILSYIALYIAMPIMDAEEMIATDMYGNHVHLPPDLPCDFTHSRLHLVTSLN